MRHLFLLFFITVLGLGLITSEASAKRFGGGRSFGVQRSQSSLSKPFASPNSSAYGRKANTNRWGGILGGLLVGGLLASLFMGNGLAQGLLTWIILGAVVLFIIGFFRRRMQPGLQSAQGSPLRQDSFSHFTKPVTESSSNGNFSDYPAQFDADSFLRQAKVTFIRLQSAYDEKNLDDLQVFTAPEVYGEIKMQLEERGDEPNKTEIVTLDAKLLDVSKQTLSYLASVRFTGSLKENDGPIAQLDEIWHFKQFSNTKDWVIAGIQQEIVQPV
ncbi:MAG: Tim44 domain-containing protein [Legionella sp.]|nr:Tim44 domain-containing protein [Legionella sp.]